MMMICRLLLMMIFFFFSIINALPCGENEILLHNRTCKCPFFQFNGRCMRKRYQTTVNSTVEQFLQTTRHLLGKEQLLLTIDATNYEQMRALAAALTPPLTMVNAGTVVTSVIDSYDQLIGGSPSATMEIVNASIIIDGTVLTLTVEFRLPDVDFFFWFMHFGSLPTPCPPFDAMDGCCRGDMGNEFLTTGVDCSGNAQKQFEQFVARWDGILSIEKQQFTVSIDLEKNNVPSSSSSTSRSAKVYSLGIGMVVFGKLAQNSESRIEIQLNNTMTATSVGAFQYSGIEFSRLQLETCGMKRVFMHLIVKASNISSVQSIRFQLQSSNIWETPNCSQTKWIGNTSMGCNVSIDSEFVNVFAPFDGSDNNNIIKNGITLYVLLSRADVLTRVVARADGGIIDHCNQPVVVPNSKQNRKQFVIDVLQGNRVKYSGQAEFVQLTDVAALTLRVRRSENSSLAYAYSIDNVSVVYSLVNSSLILSLMPDGKVTKQLEDMCENGNVCLLETLFENGFCQTFSKCENQNETGLFLMPLYPWGRETLTKGTYTAMLVDIKEELIITEELKTDRSSSSTLRRLLNWMRF